MYWRRLRGVIRAPQRLGMSSAVMMKAQAGASGSRALNK